MQTRLIPHLILTGLLFINGTIFANPKAETLFKTGLTHYQKKQYGLAIPPLENAIKLKPKNAKYHHILAVSYGLKAKQVNWFSAINLAKKTLKHLEIAANLDKENIEVLDDLMDFYREAPRVLGGDKKKADKIEDLIGKLNRKQSKSNTKSIEN